MSAQQPSNKAFISASEMADLLFLSKSRFFSLIRAGVFPKAVQHEFCKRPVFSLELQQKCLEIRQTGIGNNGQPVVFNRMRANRRPRTRRPEQPQSAAHDRHDEHADLIEAMKSLGLMPAVRPSVPGGEQHPRHCMSIAKQPPAAATPTRADRPPT